VVHAVKQLPSFHGNRRFISVLTRTRIDPYSKPINVLTLNSLLAPYYASELKDYRLDSLGSIHGNGILIFIFTWFKSPPCFNPVSIGFYPDVKSGQSLKVTIVHRSDSD
jgi:hypothetical protein